MEPVATDLVVLEFLFRFDPQQDLQCPFGDIRWVSAFHDFPFHFLSCFADLLTLPVPSPPESAEQPELTEKVIVKFNTAFDSYWSFIGPIDSVPITNFVITDPFPNFGSAIQFRTFQGMDPDLVSPFM